MIVWFVLFTFGLGFMLVWTYAAIRPRFGAGIKTAVCASTLVWGLAYLYPNLFMIIINLFPRDMMVMATVWGLIEIIIAGIAGAWVYTEPDGRGLMQGRTCEIPRIARERALASDRRLADSLIRAASRWSELSARADARDTLTIECAVWYPSSLADSLLRSASRWSELRVMVSGCLATIRPSSTHRVRRMMPSSD